MKNYTPKIPDDKINDPAGNVLNETFKLFVGFLFLLFLGTGIIYFLSWVLTENLSLSQESQLFNKIKSLKYSSAQMDVKKNLFLTNLKDKILKGHWAKDNIEIGYVCFGKPNAFAVPGGQIILSASLLKSVKSENGLAMVIGHEIGHIIKRHHLSGLGVKIFLKIIGSRLNLSAFEKIVDLTELSFSRDLESDADEVGIELQKNLYGHLRGASDFFVAISKTESAFGDFLRTHPGSEKRIQNIEKRGLNLGELTPLSIDFNDLCPTPKK